MFQLRYPATTDSFILSWIFGSGFFIPLILEALCTSETSVYFKALSCIQKSCRSEKLKFHNEELVISVQAVKTPRTRCSTRNAYVMICLKSLKLTNLLPQQHTEKDQVKYLTTTRIHNRHVRIPLTVRILSLKLGLHKAILLARGMRAQKFHASRIM
jgi:hypothetical protein